MLQLLGLSTLSERLYQAVLADPASSVATLARDTGMTDHQIRSALDELADLALLRPSVHADGTLWPVSPAVGLSALLAAAEDEAAARQRQIEATRTAIATLAAEHDEHRHHRAETAVLLDGLDSVRGRLEELAANATAECLSLDPGGAHRPDARAASSRLDEQALRRGVAVKTICRESFRNDPGTLAHAHRLTELGGQLRTVPIVPAALVIVDRRVVILPLDPTDPRCGALEVDSPGMLSVACALFDQLWSVADPFGACVPVDGQGLTAAERTLLELAAAGHTDEAAGRRLGVSARTVKRQMADLMDRLGAASRFQAGARAAHRGWL
ncbi:helix-turn-helix domain-containing protein [Streptomyces sp. CBMA156]|uniref:helix-turn-helix domain-containing protein n=1 Tax=Streptomyces sp. CBMA156 TaxID=1930280 RepID=UPI001661B162|nr:helix-turn-helix transcriptional regulator [Streptomyces sp. CBMA156]MBD0669721.1 helix-turn-helix transcriptional regulator [Streptomyces sp. CBMA156]MBD0672947.1 helix-turn-helix transcriptional regulator [Streptomyces sp. CBMA156]